MKLYLRRPIYSKASSYHRQYARSFVGVGAAAQQGTRQLRSAFWIPQATLTRHSDGPVDVGQLLIRAGYFRQAYSGIFHMLPLGLRVQSKIEALVDKHMQSLQASKVSLSSISSQKLWDQSGRLHKGSEFFKFKDRKDGEWLLAPTHEEEITTLVKDVVHAPNHLPIRLYQVSRKYRDEKRPRGGLLRGREFIMKDLYTFDKTEADAHATYADVRKAYSNLFDELNLPYIEARADSGDMGGSLSHEFHFPSELGEDDVITCSTCGYARNEEFVAPLTTTRTPIDAISGTASGGVAPSSLQLRSQSFLSKDRRTLVKAFAQCAEADGPDRIVNPFAIKECLNGEIEVDTGVEDADAVFASRLESDSGSRMLYLFDQLIGDDVIRAQLSKDVQMVSRPDLLTSIVKVDGDGATQSHLLKKETGDVCPDCAATGRAGILQVTKAIEVGHTFHLGDRYSSKLDFMVPGSAQKGPDNRVSYISMGCHGIGVSRLIAATASALSDGTGLVWPRAIAPFEVLIVVNNKQKDLAETVDIGNRIYDDLAGFTEAPADVLIDDRQDVDFGWKLKDADLIGYPVIVVLGKNWVKQKQVEIQCRRLNVRTLASLEDAPNLIRGLLAQM